MTTTGWILSIAFLMVGLVAGYFAGLGSRTKTTDNQEIQRDAIAHQLSTGLEPVANILTTLDNKIGQMDVAQKNQLGWVIQQLQQSQQVERDVLEATKNLDTALRQAPKRGTWGEVSLRRVLEMSGLTKHIDFGEQVRTARGLARPDVVVQLPGKAALVIDAKVPLDAYLRSFDDETDTTQAMSDHVRAVRTHINQLASRKYSDVVEGALDAVILYMPSEALIAASFDADPNLFDQAMSKGIIVAGPSSLHTLLRAVGHVWSQQSLEQDAQEILTLGRTLVDRINILGEHLTKLGDTLRQTVANYNRTVGSFEQRLAVSARSINSFERSVKPSPDLLDEAVRDPHHPTHHDIP
ncbi:MAG: DNA recombination protein RmuC [Actinomycetaceae bacterium]|nr:DNA recombination protein RmuC [Actinomycetaceae bacterium]